MFDHISLVFNALFQWEEPGLLGATDDSRTEAETHKMSLEHLERSESKELPEKHKDQGMLKGHRSQLKEPPWSKLEQFEQKNNVLDDNSKYKINIHESIVI